MSSDYAPAAWLGNDAIHFGGWPVKFAPRWIIIHGTDGDMTVQAIAETFAQRGSSTHFGIGRGGEVAQYVPLDQAAWGNGPITGSPGVAIAGEGNAHDLWWDASPDGNPNTETVSIEHCKPGGQQNATPLTAAQQASSFALIAYLCRVLGIPPHVYSVASTAQLAQGGITGHFSMDPIERRNCPGAYPWQALAAFLAKGETVSQLPNGWTDDGTTLVAPNGVHVMTAKREHVLDYPGGWPAELVPVTTSQGINGAGDTAQDFALRLVWTAANGSLAQVPGVAVDVEAVARLTAQVTQLEAELAAAGSSGSVEALAAVAAIRAALAAK